MSAGSEATKLHSPLRRVDASVRAVEFDIPDSERLFNLHGISWRRHAPETRSAVEAVDQMRYLSTCGVVEVWRGNELFLRVGLRSIPLPNPPALVAFTAAEVASWPTYYDLTVCGVAPVLGAGWRLALSFADVLPTEDDPRAFFWRDFPGSCEVGFAWHGVPREWVR